jgi:hypothetical protein
MFVRALSAGCPRVVHNSKRTRKWLEISRLSKYSIEKTALFEKTFSDSPKARISVIKYPGKPYRPAATMYHTSHKL